MQNSFPPICHSRHHPSTMYLGATLRVEPQPTTRSNMECRSATCPRGPLKLETAFWEDTAEVSPQIQGERPQCDNKLQPPNILTRWAIAEEMNLRRWGRCVSVHSAHMHSGIELLPWHRQSTAISAACTYHVASKKEISPSVDIREGYSLETSKSTTQLYMPATSGDLRIQARQRSLSTPRFHRFTVRQASRTPGLTVH
jgi:hypothetical protein